MLLKFLLVAVPLLIGSSIYIGWRPENLIMFSWFELLGISELIAYFRSLLSNYDIPNWILYWVPNGTWTFSFTAALAFNNLRKIWLIVPVLAGISIEIGQYINYLRGTFCFGDVFAHIIGSLLALVAIRIVLSNNKGVL
ncbi:hypothetical protein [Natranaerobius trueperi]|uniref:VanZ-like domain-containing protein n=1 Tax=Natranaerobius trueperi TaxID=759412 RepID=A0A226BYD1_9FIRM|nr:hypothetical protein [Natranaerobius trueperi]OWZ83209.1 hypothetical protein CDO51_09940 [Natranaerobius trueperi]